MAVVSGRTSRLNPDAPLFIPAAYRQVEDFSPEWWDLVKTSTWFHNYWLSQHQEEEEEEESFITNSDNDNDIANLLPESFDLGGVYEEESNLDFEMQEFVGFMEYENKPQKGCAANAEALMKNLELLNSIIKERGPKYVVEPAKYREKAPQCLSPKYSPRRIQQPR